MWLSTTWLQLQLPVHALSDLFMHLYAARLSPHTAFVIYSQTSFIRIPRHPEENRWLPMCSICYAYNITGPRDPHTGA